MNIIGWNEKTGRSVGNHPEARAEQWNRKFSSQVQRIYGGQFRFIQLAEETLQADFKSNPLTAIGHWHLVDGEWRRVLVTAAGPVGVSFNNPLVTEDILKKIDDLIELQLLASEYFEKAGDLKRLEVQLTEQVLNPQLLRMTTQRPLSAPQLPLKTRLEPIELSLPCFIEGLSFHDITRMAIEIHDCSGRHSFAHFHELDADTRNSAQKLAELVGVTLFIADVGLLTAEEQRTLFLYITTKPLSTGPSFVSGSLVSLRELMDSKQLHLDLLRKLSQSHLRMTEPFEYYKQNGILEFLFSSLR